MSGHCAGLQALIKEKNPLAEWEILMSALKSKCTVKNLSQTRWSARHDACKSLSESLPEILDVLKRFSDDKDEKPLWDTLYFAVLLYTIKNSYLFNWQYSSKLRCPSLCLCKWKSGKKWVQCRDHNFQDLPEGVQEETQVLDLSDNQFLNLPNNRFYELRLMNLQRLYLKNSKIQRLSAKTFTGLQGLVELDLSENQLEKIPPKVFSPLDNLMRLNLAGNLLKILPKNVFSNLGQLIFLDISRCHISQIETRTFTGLRALEWLRLNDNMLENIPESVLPLTASLHGLSLHGNPWKCNCHLLTLHRWLDTSQDQVPQEVDPRCNEPARLRNMPVRTLKNHELACIPFVQLTGGLDIVKEGNVTLQCKVVAVPPGQPQWFLNGKRLEFDYRSSSIKNVKCFDI
ncbi:carboxypeptidase N subunit 2-like [Copidosoma floridanum]|uniref:carboxypeptidase N subunit 2-like n=1 Tax=Copidosoma floridanum TaxID=29053 RepID=UPI0006C9C806|nr:carboxypeptidase N subunit 2-like [Copidosoma floridanum]